MSELQPYIFKLPKGLKPTFPSDSFKPGDLIVAYKVDTLQYNNILLDLKKRQEKKVINQFLNENGDLKDE